MHEPEGHPKTSFTVTRNTERKNEKIQAGIRSTTKNSELVKETQDNIQGMHPTDGVSCSDNVQITNNMFCFALLADKEKGTVYKDAKGALPVMSLEGKQQYIVASDYDNNYIDAVSVSDLKDATIVDTVKTIFETMEEKGHRPCFNVTDNQAVKPLTSIKHPNKSAFHSYYGHRYTWNEYPMAPPGTRAVVYQPLSNRRSWGPRGVDA